MRHQAIELDLLSQLAPGSARVGRVVRITPDGEVLVDYPGNQTGPIRARLATNTPLDAPNQPVLLVFEDGDLCLPIIAGVVRDRIVAPAKDRLALHSEDELTLTCGKSSITLRSDGRVIVKGAEILSRASGTNKIRGASVKIN